MTLNKNVLFRVVFFCLCFVLADVTKIRVMDICGSSPCRGDHPNAPFYVEGSSNLLLAPTAVLLPIVQRTTWPVKTESTSIIDITITQTRGLWRRLKEHPLLVTVLPMHSVLIDFPPKKSVSEGAYKIATGRTAVMAYVWEKFLILLSIPWWEFLYRRLRSLWASRKGVTVCLVLGLSAFLILGTLFMRADFGGEAVVTWRLIPEVLSGGDGSALLSKFSPAG